MLSSLLEELSDGSHQCVILFGGLGGDAEMMGSKTAKVGGIADQDAVFLDQVGFEFCSSMGMDGAKEEGGGGRTDGIG